MKINNCNVPLAVHLDFQICKLSINVIERIKMGKVRRFHMQLDGNLFHFISEHFFRHFSVAAIHTCRYVFFDSSPFSIF